ATAVARRVTERLEGTYTDGHRLLTATSTFDATAGDFNLGTGFSGNDNAAVFQRLSTLVKEQGPYTVDLGALADLGFEPDETVQLVDVLVQLGHLDSKLTVPENRVAYFADRYNVLDFTLPGLEDFASDIFFVLHDTATEISAATTEIEATLDAM
ncbi:hypothetical protein ACFQ1S_44565, partial [Kibdelosporangium lantanae]